MAFVHKENTGSVFKNDKRETETQPHGKGSGLIEGVEFYISSWTNTTAKGDKYQSLKFSRKDENKAPNPSPAEADFDDDLPF